LLFAVLLDCNSCFFAALVSAALAAAVLVLAALAFGRLRTRAHDKKSKMDLENHG
jgi:hypothetical protein